MKELFAIRCSTLQEVELFIMYVELQGFKSYYGNSDPNEFFRRGGRHVVTVACYDDMEYANASFLDEGTVVLKLNPEYQIDMALLTAVSLGMNPYVEDFVVQHH